METNDNSKKWTRPKSVPVPTIWRRCVGLKEMEHGRKPKFIIQDVPEEMHEDIVDFMSTHFFRDEATLESLKVLEDPVSMKEFQEFYRKTLKQNLALVALVEDVEDKGKLRIAGCNLTGVSYKSDKITADMFQGRVTKIIIRDLMERAIGSANVFERYDVEECMIAVGLCVDPVYRGQGLGLEILKTRTDLGKAVGLNVTMTVFTAVPSQKLAHKFGMEVLTEIFYEDIQEEGKPVYPNIKSKSIKVMAKRLY
ncbi:uncharacterized protein [Periplaneta americana]|uniref:uncharacterized protein isoform X2 n=1 Tax=Periplaneta americana TaxID=6978 RepID=UPI0037E87E61